MVFSKPWSHALPLNPTYSNSFPFTSTHFHPLSLTPTYFQPTAIYFHCFYSALSHVQPTPTQFTSYPAYVLPLSPISSPLPNIHTQSNPPPTNPAHIQSLRFKCLCAVLFCALMCLRISRAHALIKFISMEITVHVYILYVSLCVSIRQDYLFTLSVLKRCL